MSDVAYSRLTEIATFASGGTPSKASPEYWGGSIPWLTPKDMSDYNGYTQDCVTTAAIGNGTRIAPAGTIFVAVRGMSLHNEIRIVLSNRPMSFNQDIKAIIPQKIDGRFLYYALLTQKPFLLSVVESAGHGTGRLPTDKLSDLLVPQFSTTAQKAIAAIFDAVDSKIENNRKMNQTLEAAARAIFKDWFIDFGPTRAKIERRARYLAADIWSLFPDSLDDEGKPEGWKHHSIYRIADVIYGAPFASAHFNTAGVGEPLIRIRDLVDETPGVWTSEIHAKGYKVCKGDIVVGMDGEFRAYLWGGAEAWLNQRVCVFAPKHGFSAAFVRNSIVSPLAHIEETETATTVIHLGKGDIDRFTAIVPCEKLTEVFNGLAQPLYDRIVANKAESRTLAATRDLLLPKLMSGEIRVCDVKKPTEAPP